MKDHLDGYYQDSLFDDFVASEYVQSAGHGGLGGFSSMSEDWFTSPDIITLVHELYGGPPDLDPMSCAEANERIGAGCYYTAEMDGLTRPWYGTMLLNPPWGGSSASSPKARAVQKAIGSYRAGEVKECVCVLNVGALTTAWFRPLLDFPICIPPRRLRHHGAHGEKDAPSSGTVIVYIGSRVADFSQVFAKLGAILVPFSSPYPPSRPCRGT